VSDCGIPILHCAGYGIPTIVLGVVVYVILYKITKKDKEKL
jgi:hypothetical protein